jgi:predicted nucleotidyltransferase
MDQSAPYRPQDDPILTRFRVAMSGIFDDRIERLVLFGSRARGEARADSDYDVAIFLKDFTDRRQEVRRLVPLVTDIVEETGVVIHPLPFRAGAWRERSPLMHEIRLDGVDL